MRMCMLGRKHRYRPVIVGAVIAVPVVPSIGGSRTADDCNGRFGRVKIEQADSAIRVSGVGDNPLPRSVRYWMPGIQRRYFDSFSAIDGESKQPPPPIDGENLPAARNPGLVDNPFLPRSIAVVSQAVPTTVSVHNPHARIMGA